MAEVKWLKLKTPLNEKPYIAHKVDGVETKTESISWQFQSIKFEEGEYNGAPTYQVVIGLQTHDGSVNLQMNITNPVESLLNSLAGAGQLGLLEISLYQEEGYARIGFKNNGQKVARKYPIDQFKSLKNTVMVNGWKITDRTNLYAWIRDTLIPEIQENNEAKFE